MRILLVAPEAGIHRLRLGSLRISFREAPLTLTTLAALVPAELHADVTIADENVQTIPFASDFDLVGVTCITGASERAYAIAETFRRRGTTVVLGGVHVSLLPHEAARHADAIVVGFAERAWPRLLRDFADGRLQRRYEQPERAALVGLPPARRDLQKHFGYMVPNTVFATRGCKAACDFCTVPAVPFGWSTRPVGDVVDEIRGLRSRRFTFNDVSIAEDRDYAKELFTALVPLRKTWGALVTTRVGTDEALLDLMARAGCAYLLTGFESPGRASLRSIHKGFNDPADYRVVVGNLHRRGIAVQGCFIFGLDHDTRAVFADTIDLCNELAIDIPRFAIYTPYPGTAAFQRLDRDGRILHRRWRYYDTQHVVFRPAQMSPRELDEGFRRAYRLAFTAAAGVRRVARSPHPIVSFFGNLAYRLYAARLQADLDRLYEPTQDHQPALACP
jgi:radical SAM superfamily enzyme YgiQ (UPF0313 family)